ncbi:MAG: adenylate/guanylate cyclase domain-containing protein [Opitutae bacterium]|nr:adenylate/guanylate cyclase domain-containing protein [Opitutae bacterium]
MLRFRSFRTRLLALILALVGLVQLAAIGIVATVHRRDARREIMWELDVAARQFRQEIARGNDFTARSARALSSDHAFKQTFASTDDAATLRSALESFKLRAQFDVVAGLALDGHILAETRAGPAADAVYRPLVAAADASAQLLATGYGMIDGELYALTAVPMRAPDVIAWFVLGHRLDRAFLLGLRETSGVEITLRQGGRTLATTVDQPDELFLSNTQTLPLADGGAAEIVLQYSWDEKLAPARRLERLLALVGGGSLLLAALCAVAVARSVSRPVRALAAHTAHVARGDYARRITLARDDELGQLAAAFNRMSEGLAERDRIRDLLDKNVSPEVAAQLLRDGGALGGEEREVTVLFADLRDFTAMSERLPPRELLALLNRYLDRMSAALEREGGVIDKFIGDAIMALFGAPLDQADAADRALHAALALQTALAGLNEELAAEGRPTLAIGVGINTARVVAGNMGSHRRLNYSVLGDGVNVAARLEALTRHPEYAATILASAATLRAARDRYATRALGEITVKGRKEPVGVHAVLGLAPAPPPATAQS